MTVREFLADRLGRLILWLGTAAVTAFFLLATGTQNGVLRIVLIVWFLIFALVQLSEFFRRRAQLKEWEAILDGLDQKYLFAECAPKSKEIYERKLLAMMRRSGKAMMEAVSDARASQREYREYIESWVHEIKTPMTAAQLLCRGTGPELSRKLSYELAQIENHVERALFYARAESPEKDFLIRRTDLAELAAQTIARHRSLLIQNGVRVETENLGHTIYTDGKWVAFMLGQFLQNAVRYRKCVPIITLSACRLGGRVQLMVDDNGMGIASHELPRIFERGFTGSNGRACGGSTGIGLYLCRRLASFLEIDLQVKSKEGEGTRVILTFPAKENLSKM